MNNANGRLEQIRMESPIASLNVPVGIGKKKESISRMPITFQKNLGSFIS